jgi:hypothetical protein
MIYTYYFWPARMKEENMVDLDVLCRICGDSFWSRVVFGMTHPDCKDEVRQRPEDGVQNKFWTTLLERGANRAFLQDSVESAEALVKLLPQLVPQDLHPPIVSDPSFMIGPRRWFKRLKGFAWESFDRNA